MIAACATHIPLPGLPAQVTVLRDGRRVSSAPQTTETTTTPGLFLQAGDETRVAGSAVFTFSYAGNRFQIRHGVLRLGCRRVLTAPGRASPARPVLAVDLMSGRVDVRSGARPRRALVLSSEMLAFATMARTNFVVERDPAARSTRAWTSDRLIVTASAADQTLRINTRLTYTAISDRRGLRLNIWPFSISQRQRPSTPNDHLAPFWADGLPCSVGCTPPGVRPGWPIAPFHSQHAIRAGINELRPANAHVAVDIEAADFQPVYALQSGYASIRYPGTGDVNVDVGDFYYWHIKPAVVNGQRVVAYKTEIGQVLAGFGHLALSEGNTADYLNPLRPGGVLRPYRDSEPPNIGIPHFFPDGRVTVGAFDPQSFIDAESYLTPVLAPASLAWRLYDARGRAETGLEWAMRGSQNFAPGLRSVIFAPGASNPGFECFLERKICVPNWVYRLAGGLTEPLPLDRLPPGRYRLAVYAWDWAGNTSALDDWIKLPRALAASASRSEIGPLAPNFDYP